MEKNNQLIPLAGMTLEDMYKVVKQLDMPLFTAKQLCQWIYGKRVTTFGEMLNISKANRERLAQN